MVGKSPSTPAPLALLLLLLGVVLPPQPAAKRPIDMFIAEYGYFISFDLITIRLFCGDKICNYAPVNTVHKSNISSDMWLDLGQYS